MKNILPAIVLLAGLVPAQASLYNLTIPVGCQATVIDWNGKPALCITRMGAGAMAEFWNVRAPNWYARPQVELTIQGIGVLDARPCAQGAVYGLADMTESRLLTMPIPPSGLFMDLQWPVSGSPLKLDGRGYAYDFQDPVRWDVRSCRSNGGLYYSCSKGTCLDDSPEGVCVVAYLSIK